MDKPSREYSAPTQRVRRASKDVRGSLTSRCVALLIGLAIAGCASAGSQQTQQHVDPRQVAKPGVILVYDFETGTPQTQQDRAVASAFSEQFVGALKARGINARRANPSTQTPMHAFLAKGQFVSIEKGSRGQRVLIGFGAGKEELNVRVQIYQVTPQGPRLLSEGVGEAEGGKTPGMAAPAIVAVTTGNPIGLLVGGLLNVKREAGDPLKDDIKRLAKELAERAETFYKRQGWL